MADALAAVEAAIREVTKARQSVMRGKSKQVSSGDETDHLKSVAYAWFQSHQPIIRAHPSLPDLSGVDLAYRTIMDSTGRHASRTTYADALRDAIRSLVEVRSFVAANFHAAPVATANPTNDAPPNFAPLAADPKMQAILQRRWDEVQRCLACKSNLAATVMMGGLLESLLLARINSSPNKGAVFKAKSAPRDKKTGITLMLPDWKLIHMVAVAHEFTWITKSAMDVGNVLRDFRNYIHPHKEYTDGVLILDEDARMFWEVTKSISRHVLASVGITP
jgi:hypothetical protein